MKFAIFLKSRLLLDYFLTVPIVSSVYKQNFMVNNLKTRAAVDIKYFNVC